MLKVAGVSVIGSIGVVETVSLSASTASIQDAFYGNGTSVTPATVAADGMSLKFTVTAGLNVLTVNLIAPAPTTESVELYQGKTILRIVTMGGLTGTGLIPIMGQ